MAKKRPAKKCPAKTYKVWLKGNRKAGATEVCVTVSADYAAITGRGDLEIGLQSSAYMYMKSPVALFAAGSWLRLEALEADDCRMDSDMTQ